MTAPDVAIDDAPDPDFGNATTALVAAFTARGIWR